MENKMWLLEHGSRSTFVNHGCRCEGCCAADKLYRDSYLDRNRARKRAYLVEWRKDNPSYDRTRYAENPDWYKAKNQRRRARKGEVDCGCVSSKSLSELREVYGNQCVYCGGGFEHLDHFHPLSLGGVHCVSNLRPSCASCNTSKGAKPPEEWLGLRYSEFEQGRIDCGE